MFYKRIRNGKVTYWPTLPTYEFGDAIYQWIDGRWALWTSAGLI